MKKTVLIGTPIHELKDYCMERWVKNVAELIKVYPCDIIMVDNSPKKDYMEKVKGYMQKYGIDKYEMKYLQIDQGDLVPKDIHEQIHERVAKCQEIIRQYALEHDYDVWFSWECDQIIPIDALDKLLSVMETGDYIMVNHNIWDKNVPGGLCFDWGVTLVSREYLQKYGFLLDFKEDPKPDTWYNAQAWYRQRLKRDGARFIDLVGVIDPVLHL
jgi:hypothetical protein